MTSRLPPKFQGGQAPDLPSPTIQAIRGINEFAFRLLSELAKTVSAENLFCSPCSIAIAFAMVGHGASGKTREQILNCFGLSGLSHAEIGAAFELFAKHYVNADAEITLSMANSLWQTASAPVNPDYVDDVKRLYAAAISNIDFGQPDAAEIVNQWVAVQTKGKITQLLTPPDLAGAELALLNAIYFKANWQKRFDPSRTVDRPYTLLDGKVEMRPFMQQLARFDYYEHQFFQAVDLPYGAGNYRMAVILPRSTVSFSEFQQRFDNADWQEIRSHFRQNQVSLSLPRFGVMQHQLLNSTMKQLGITRAFEGTAEFPSISEGLFISKVIHQATLIVNEEGSEATAATAITMARSGPSRPVEMTVDHPFLCIIYHADHGTILFAGHILDPQ